MFALVLAAAVTAAPVASDPAVIELTRLEQQWSEAFVKRDFAFMERIVSPEYQHVLAHPDGSFSVIRRKEWMRNTRAWTHQAFGIEIVDVNRAGDTAVVSAQGLWTVTMGPGTKPQSVRFFVTDTWARRHGSWRVVQSFSQRLPDAAWPPVAPSTPPAN